MKSPRYAESGIREYWLVNLPGETLEFHREPDGDAWRQVLRLRRGETVAPLAFPDHELPVDRILG